MTKKRVTIIMAPPGYGKSRIVKLIKTGKAYEDWKYTQLLKGHRCDTDYIFGLYGSEVEFPGTDRLSFTVMNEVRDFFNTVEEGHVIFEGDRLLGPKVVAYAEEAGWEVELISLRVDEQEWKSRLLNREHRLTEKFIKGRVTKVGNMERSFPNILKVFDHNQPSDTLVIAAHILRRSL